MAKKTKSNLTVETLTHYDATRKNIPTAEYQSVMRKDDHGKSGKRDRIILNVKTTK